MQTTTNLAFLINFNVQVKRDANLVQVLINFNFQIFGRRWTNTNRKSIHTWIEAVTTYPNKNSRWWNYLIPYFSRIHAPPRTCTWIPVTYLTVPWSLRVVQGTLTYSSWQNWQVKRTSNMHIKVYTIEPCIPRAMNILLPPHTPIKTHPHTTFLKATFFLKQSILYNILLTCFTNVCISMHTTFSSAYFSFLKLPWKNVHLCKERNMPIK